jgi:acetyl esterase/lipase
MEQTFLWPDATLVGASSGAEAATARPSLTHFPAPESRGGVLICPGGGYGGLAVDHEAKDIAAWLNERHYDGWLLRYRVAPHGSQNGVLYPAPLNDALRALELVRQKPATGPLGVWGFSAGGHLAATLATEPGTNLDFAILCYPVITLEATYGHVGSQTNLLGGAASNEEISLHSAHNRVSAATPPTFIFHTSDDASVPVKNALLFYEALHKYGISAEMHIYESGPHGVGLAPEHEALKAWPALLDNWLKRRTK